MILSGDDPRLKDRVIDALNRREAVIIPCDTIYGLVGMAPDTESLIRRIKGRGETNPFLQLVASVEQASSLAAEPLDPRVADLWPGPLTVVLRARKGTVAVRFPNDPFLVDIVQGLGSPVYSTSVNRSGSPPMWRIAEIMGEFEDEVGLIVNAGDRPMGLPSTLLDVTRRPYRVLRQGQFRVPNDLLASP